MKLTNYAHIVFGTALMIFSACSREDIAIDTTEKNAHSLSNGTGAPIIFGSGVSNANFNSKESAQLADKLFPKETRTAFADQETWNKSLDLTWVAQDQMSIIQFTTTADGTVNNTSTAFSYMAESTSKKSKLKYTTTPLKWFEGSNISAYHFISTYPKIDERIDNDNDFRSKGHIDELTPSVPISDNNLVNVTFTTPAFQVVECNTQIGPNGEVFYRPDMKQYFEVGYGTTANQSIANINYKPILSCITLKISAPDNENTQVDSVKLRLFKGNQYVGFAKQYKATFDKNLSITTLQRVGSDVEDVTIKLWNANGTDDTQTRQSLEAGKSMVITAFLPPENLTIDNANQYRVQAQVFYEKTSHYTSLAIGNPHGLEQPYRMFSQPATTKLLAATKTKIADPGNWEGELPSTTPIRNLSLPAAHLAMWAISPETGLPSINHSNQDISIKDMLDAGIRAFDIRVARSWDIDYFGVPGSFNYPGNNEDLFRYKEQVKITDGINTLARIISDWRRDHTKETLFFFVSRVAAVATTQEHNGKLAIYQLWEFLNKNDYVITNMKSDLTLKDTEGKIVFIVRPDPGGNSDAVSSNDAPTGTEKDSWYSVLNYPKNICVLKGWHPTYGNDPFKFSPALESADGTYGTGAKTYSSYKYNQDQNNRYWWEAPMFRGEGVYTDKTDNFHEGGLVDFRNVISLGSSFVVFDYEIMRYGTYAFKDARGNVKTGLSARDFRIECLKDFWQYINTRPNDWAAATIPYWQPNNNYKYNPFSQTSSNDNWWAMNITNGETRMQDPIINLIKPHLGRNRLGFVFIDGIPKKGDPDRGRVRELIEAIMVNNYLTNVPAQP